MARPIKRTLIVVSAAFILFLCSVFFLPDVFTDAIAPLCDLFAAGLIFHAILSSKNRNLRINFIFAGAAVLTWLAADTLWMIDAQLLNTDPDNNTLIAALYFLTNVFLLFSTLAFSFTSIRKWDTVQLILDAATFSLATLWFIWVLLFNKQQAAMGFLQNNSVMNTVTIGIDFFLIVIAGIWFLSVKNSNVPWFLKILLSSVCFFAVVDLAYMYLYAVDRYVPDTLVDACYMASLLGVAYGVKLYYIQYPSAFTDEGAPKKGGKILRYKTLILLIYPIILIIVKGFIIIDIAFFVVLLAAYEYGRNYIKNAINDRMLLSRQQDMNLQLEQLVAEQTKSLQSANAELQKRNRELKFANQHDPLTGLHNRAFFLDALEGAIKDASEKSNSRVALIIWNVDNLKGINDTYGHLTGDMILVQHTQRVQAAISGAVMLVRLGGDEFAIILRGDLPEEDILRTARQVVETCKEPFRIHGYTFNVTVGAGIAVYPTCASDRSSLLRNADVAMHYAKTIQADGHIATYMDMNTVMDRKHMLSNHLKTLDFDRDLRLYFQPQFRIADKKLIGMEALLRWDCPGIGPVSPAEFIPIAEEENLIIPIGNWVITNAVMYIARWNLFYHTNLRMGINISPKQFDQNATYEVLDSAIKQHHAMFKWIDIEITEGVALDFENSAGNIKKYFKTKQLTVSIDDFGTGYSSLGYLTILSFDRLKIAKPLVDKITSDESKRKIITSIILLAKSLDLATIAEGVETKAQFDLLEELGCDQIQGYYLGKPVPADVFEKTFLKEIKP